MLGRVCLFFWIAIVNNVTSMNIAKIRSTGNSGTATPTPTASIEDVAALYCELPDQLAQNRYTPVSNTLNCVL
jgi:hypothetical protein